MWSVYGSFFKEQEILPKKINISKGDFSGTQIYTYTFTHAIHKKKKRKKNFKP